MRLLPTFESTGDILVFDVETTGTDRRSDQVIELCIQFGLGDPRGSGAPPSRTWRIRPSVAISPGAQAVHGISMEDLAGCPSFGELAEELRAIFDRAEVLVGYNLTFDIDMIQAEYERLGLPLLDLSAKRIVDPFRLWQQCEPRTLQDAHRRFAGGGFDEAHSAAADVAATGRVLQGMLAAFDLEGRSWDAIAGVCEPERATWIGPSRHVRWDEEGAPVLGFGKHAGARLDALARTDGGTYLRWILGKDFPPHVHEICRKAFELRGDALVSWIAGTFGGAPSAGQSSSAGAQSACDRSVA
jgi:DNA polymerase III subunit epsilon